MNVSVIIIDMIVFAALFTIMCFKTTGGNTTTQVENYPPDIQEEYFKTHERVDVSYKSKKVILVKLSGILVFIAILFVCALIAGAKTFKEGFFLSFGLMVWIGLYDTLFLDWVLFANMPIFRLEGTEYMDEAYHQKWFHLKGIIFPGLIFALIPAAVVGWLVTLVR